MNIGPEHIDDVILINRLLANKYRNQGDLESTLKGERFQGLANWINIAGKNKQLSDKHGDFYKRNGEYKHIDTPFHIKFSGEMILEILIIRRFQESMILDVKRLKIMEMNLIYN